jgi:uncharacterized protein
MNEVFADSFYFIALLNPRDRFHATTLAASQDRSRRLVTTHWVLMEVADALCAPAMRGISERFVRGMLVSTEFLVIWELTPWLNLGLDLFSQRPDKSWSLTDCTSFAVMEARGIRHALTGDHHFVQAGFVAMLSAPAS